VEDGRVADPVYRPVITTAFSVFRALDLDITVHGHELLPRTGGAVLATSHWGYLDFALAGAATWMYGRRYVRFLAKQEIWTHPLAGPLMRGMHHIPVDRAAGDGAFQHAVKALRAGELVGLHPEGTVSLSFTTETLRSGAARMAAEADVPVVPMVIWGSQRVLTKGRRRDLRAARHVPIDIWVGESLRPTPADDPQAATAQLRLAMSGLAERAAERYADRPSPTDPPAWWMPAHLGGGAPTPEEAEARKAARRLRG